ncbi:MAG: multicomponent Na+:H+ antiporter subunit [Thermococcaceae archaeon]|jgi:multicomponent Na+:H+ antiporter subunit G|uniref:monovalent cation/H(+) antiporter subunit G n=1 Tax=Thermococcus TaxID=2263 RepID=UPI00128DE587|nr:MULTISPECIES: monovalent cation/H(+) antiporter subunit G [Thermococcus]MDK2783440.1 multicomponent Na+:H+ antiporter subunit [Thermococcaceae archaeon]MCA6213924.1 Na+/H+ antiporter subunit G [Thermococcus bergensis]MDK2854144.1 multicomponent Na+:H+ antiporter subunit [Thermococcaceae archaeon]MDK2983892.1 multicomponent Na+:H+ antiporter subunit [Thermococcaceae archaeon]MDN5321520.1 multicomponent Na+:H+ antiporter subunit [Thermococcaceae archaeon]
MSVASIIGQALVLFGTFFYVLSSLGLIRMPDVYNRMQTATKSATLGSLGVIVGTGIWAVGELGSYSWIPKTLIIAVFLLLTNPIAAHALIRAAYKSGVPLWEGTVVDKYKEAEGSLERVNEIEEKLEEASQEVETNE